MKILVTGTKTWPGRDTALIESWLYRYELAAMAEGETLTVAHGHRKSGPERVTDEWVTSRAKTSPVVCPPERHPIDWRGECNPRCRPKHRRPARNIGPGNHAPRSTDMKDGTPTTCPSAGIYRNEGVVAAGGFVVCLAFLDLVEERAGALHMAAWAQMCRQCRTSARVSRLVQPALDVELCPACKVAPQGIPTYVIRP